jgi:hypothetical protein
MDKTTSGVVYWLYDESCTDITRHGYIGACVRLDARLRAHRRNPGSYESAIGIPVTDFQVKIIFTGPIDECQNLEAKLRPHGNIGWNRKRGGGRSPLGTRYGTAFKQRVANAASKRFKGIPKSLEQRKKMREAALRRYEGQTPINPRPSRLTHPRD